MVRQDTKRAVVRELYKNGVSEREIIKGMKEVFSTRYDMSRLKRDIQGLSSKDINRDSNYLREQKKIEAAYSQGSISKNVYDEYRNRKPRNMVIGYSISHDILNKPNIHDTLRESITGEIDEFYEYGEYWVEGSP
jgi:hypothetical protein